MLWCLSKFTMYLKLQLDCPLFPLIKRTNHNIKRLQILIVINIAFLQEIAGMFSAVGMCEQAVTAFTKVSPILTTSRIVELCTL